MVDDDAVELVAEIKAARADLPRSHQALLDEIGVQETAVDDWPDGVIDLYRTVGEPAPPSRQLDGAAAVWLGGPLRTVAFNTTSLRRALEGLDAQSRRWLVSVVAWHEYGHALSVARATDDHRRRGPDLLALAPGGVRNAIDYPARYRAGQVFDELMATLYATLVGDVRHAGYVQPEYLHPDVFAAFREVIPWPQIP